jgi:hypothetical protein
MADEANANVEFDWAFVTSGLTEDQVDALWEAVMALVSAMGGTIGGAVVPVSDDPYNDLRVMVSVLCADIDGGYLDAPFEVAALLASLDDQLGRMA